MRLRLGLVFGVGGTGLQIFGTVFVVDSPAEVQHAFHEVSEGLGGFGLIDVFGDAYGRLRDFFGGSGVFLGIAYWYLVVVFLGNSAFASISEYIESKLVHFEYDNNRIKQRIDNTI